MRSKWARILRWTLVGIHALLVLPAAWFWLAAASDAARDSPDANIGAGLIGLYLLVFGAPWSMTAWLFNLNSLADPMRDAFIVGLPLLNLIIHAVVVRAWERRGSRAERDQAPIAAS